MNANQVWQAALGELQSAMSSATFETWVKNTIALGQQGTTFTIAAPNTFAKEWLDTRFRPEIEKTLGRIIGRPAHLDVVVEGFGKPKATEKPARPRRPEASALQTPLLQPPAEADDSPFAVAEPPRPTRRLRARPPTNGPSPEATPAPAGPSLNPPPPQRYNDERWTFQTFIVGPSNRFAFAAAQAVAAEPATAYNPLFIHGGVGLGKTHLLHAIAQQTAARGLQVLYVTCEQFTNDLIDAIQRRQTDEFRAAYRSNDVLLIDDIQFLAGKESTQEEFFHTFNDLHGARRQIVISSDRPPRAIATLEQRLTSRFEWGLIVDIQPPDLETRTAILRTRAREMRPPVPAEVIDLLAQRVQRNVRELEGSLTTAVAYARLNGLPLTVETAGKALAEVTEHRGREVQPADVLAAVARHYRVEPKLLRGKQRDREIVVPRQVAMYLMREETTASLLEIGRELGGRDHSTVLHGWEKIKGEVEVDDRLRKDVLAIREKLLTG
ncbi:MAG TPA: chromosomal replication initiator protein DnaA [Chloroflexota bacterium]